MISEWSIWASSGVIAEWTPNTVPVPAALDNVLADTLRITPHNPDILPPTQHFTPPSSPLDPPTWGEARLYWVCGVCGVCGGSMLIAAKSSRHKCDQVMGQAHTDRLRPSTHVIRR